VQQDKDMYDALAAPTVSTVLSIAAHDGRKAAVVDIGGAVPNAVKKTGVEEHMRLDRATTALVQEISRRQGVHRGAL
jgi:hypothetical protein